MLVKFNARARREYGRLPSEIQRRLAVIVGRLEHWPAVSGARPLTGALSGWYRIRTGDYRIRFYVSGDIVLVDRIGHRRDFYQD